MISHDTKFYLQFLVMISYDIKFCAQFLVTISHDIRYYSQFLVKTSHDIKFYSQFLVMILHDIRYYSHSLWIKPADALNSNFIGITTPHVSGSLSAHHQEFLAVHRLWYISCSCDRLLPGAPGSKRSQPCTQGASLHAAKKQVLSTWVYVRSNQCSLLQKSIAITR
jgi:hypothetical protein